MLRDEVRRRSAAAAAGSTVNLICEGGALKDCDDGQFLAQLGLKRNSRVLASVASPDEGKALDEVPASEAERSSELSRLKADSVALTERHTNSG
ncbi:uncharacterized protein A4U43_C03F3320 [Asparagus officinalis]|uniref:Ubiquitin-like domain-containing protein n=1 Tax=Asparagus officinalis TaxID=4686 RepID=A0A5P1F7Q4_ASPOF|nr:uncharacterized protein A4U43_C03F3320 [Asparagus officinalis]